MTIGNMVNGAGLVFDIAGALLLWRFGLPENVNRRGESALLLEGTDDAH